jgi:hypothetical protein
MSESQSLSQQIIVTNFLHLLATDFHYTDTLQISILLQSYVT